MPRIAVLASLEYCVRPSARDIHFSTSIVFLLASLLFSSFPHPVSSRPVVVCILDSPSGSFFLIPPTLFLSFLCYPSLSSLPLRSPPLLYLHPSSIILSPSSTTPLQLPPFIHLLPLLLFSSPHHLSFFLNLPPCSSFPPLLSLVTC